MKQQKLQNTLENDATKNEGNVQLLESDEQCKDIEHQQKVQNNNLDIQAQEISNELPLQDDSEALNEEKVGKVEEPSNEKLKTQENDETIEEQETIEEAPKLEEDSPEEKRKKATRRFIIFFIILTLLITVIICFKLGNIGFNAFTAWGVDNIELTSENLQILNNTKLNIFGDAKKENGFIAPNSSGTYRFSVKNNSDYNMIYNINFEDAMSSFINMKYRLKIDNIYVRGNEKEYVSIEELDLENIVVPKGSINIYTLEWCWVDDDKNDTMIGSMEGDQYYYFRLQITSNIYDKGAQT